MLVAAAAGITHPILLLQAPAGRHVVVFNMPPRWGLQPAKDSVMMIVKAYTIVKEHMIVKKGT
jgi:hypothetical protein